MSSPSTERRCLAAGELRALRGEAGPTLEGYAAVFGKRSEDLGGFVEVIERGFFGPALGQDVRALWNHDPAHVLGRTRAGTLALVEDAVGLKCRIRLPETQAARDLLVSVERGDVNQMSFGFRVAEGGEEWAEEGAGVYRRTLKAQGCAQLYDVSPVTFPAYPDTSVAEARRLALAAAQTSRGRTRRFDRSFLHSRHW